LDIDSSKVSNKNDYSREMLIGRKSVGLELQQRERRLTELSQEKDEQLGKWLSKYNKFRKHSLNNKKENIN
jgi:hypothetical protein